MKAWRRPPGSAVEERAPAETVYGGPEGEEAGWVTVSTGATAIVTGVLRWAA
ncbi:hypothetical protein [Streptomyces formicae]|uniref:Uncharacterized protein n=1 Tax=Streptomyces formicae TaxID=1616117 RepID=A0ABY3WK22_9ACTN|nr:hypothetical protein [Streptomyces formicae]UNM11829.1 hypothetical protein J4032_09985 [Streptomyces formicae]